MKNEVPSTDSLDYKKAMSVLRNIEQVERAINKQYAQGKVDHAQYTKLISDLSLQKQNLSLFIEASQNKYPEQKLDQADSWE